MAFSSSDDDDVVSDINITPLVDVMLVLLVSFIVTIPAISKSVHVNLPKTEATQSAQQKDHVDVSIDADGALFLDRQPLADTAELLSRIAVMRASGADLSVNVRADEHASYAPIAKAIAALEKSGISHLSLVTAPQ
jgi:biopolymer transport protein ExbD